MGQKTVYTSSQVGQSNSVTALMVQVLLSVVKSVSGIDKCCEG